MMRKPILLFLVSLMLLTGCVTMKPPVQPRPQDPSGPQATPDMPRPPLERKEETPSSTNAAVGALVEKARAQHASKQTEQAGATLERALRIEPRNPVIWHELARVRLTQGKYAQAENLAAKSNTLAGENRRLKSENWRIIGQARSKLGDHQGARAAFAKAEAGF
jgi:cytochrome c-type biogenesis protein CcmH/NrfG